MTSPSPGIPAAHLLTAAAFALQSGSPSRQERRTIRRKRRWTATETGGSCDQPHPQRGCSSLPPPAGGQQRAPSHLLQNLMLPTGSRFRRNRSPPSVMKSFRAMLFSCSPLPPLPNAPTILIGPQPTRSSHRGPCAHTRARVMDHPTEKCESLLYGHATYQSA